MEVVLTDPELWMKCNLPMMKTIFDCYFSRNVLHKTKFADALSSLFLPYLFKDQSACGLIFKGKQKFLGL